MEKSHQCCKVAKLTPQQKQREDHISLGFQSLTFVFVVNFLQYKTGLCQISDALAAFLHYPSCCHTAFVCMIKPIANTSSPPTLHREVCMSEQQVTGLNGSARWRNVIWESGWLKGKCSPALGLLEVKSTVSSQNVKGTRVMSGQKGSITAMSSNVRYLCVLFYATHGLVYEFCLLFMTKVPPSEHVRANFEGVFDDSGGKRFSKTWLHSYVCRIPMQQVMQAAD